MRTQLLTIKELSKILSIKESTIRSAVFNKKIPYLKIGRLIRFNLNQIDSFILENTVEVRSNN